MQDSTISDFGEQWARYHRPVAELCSAAALQDHAGPLMDIAAVAGVRAADIGSGAGCTALMLLDAGAREVTVVEPSAAMAVCRRNTELYADRVRYVHATGAELPLDDYDLVTSIGVIHHISDPDPVVRRALEALRPGGIFLVWLYGHEGNRLYLALVEPLRRLTTKLPDALLAFLSWPLAGVLTLYARLSTCMPLPMRDYMRDVILTQPWRYRVITVFDQLNPAYTKYYRREEVIALLERNGFANVGVYHRSGYSWTVTGTRPHAASRPEPPV